MEKTFDNRKNNGEPHQNRFPILDVWFTETEGETLKVVTREDEDVHLFRSTCVVFFGTKEITVR